MDAERMKRMQDAERMRAAQVHDIRENMCRAEDILLEARLTQACGVRTSASIDRKISSYLHHDPAASSTSWSRIQWRVCPGLSATHESCDSLQREHTTAQSDQESAKLESQYAYEKSSSQPSPDGRCKPCFGNSLMHVHGACSDACCQGQRACGGANLEESDEPRPWSIEDMNID